MAGTKVGVGEVEEVGEGEAKRSVPHELEALVRGVIREGRVGEGFHQERRLAEGVAKKVLDLRHGRHHIAVILRLRRRLGVRRTHCDVIALRRVGRRSAVPF